MHTLRGRTVDCGKLLFVGLVLGAGVAFVFSRWRRRWVRVGRVTGLNVFPVKSCRGTPLTVGRATSIGLEEVRPDGSAGMGDRLFVVYQADTMEVVTARRYPQMLQVVTRCEPDVTLTYLEHRTVVAHPAESTERRVKLWSETVSVVDAGDAVSSWLCANVFAAEGFRLGRWPPRSARRNIDHLIDRYKRFYPNLCARFTGAFSDLSAYLLVNEASIADLNHRMAAKGASSVVTPTNFRANIVIDGPTAYTEDNWRRLRIGEHEFTNFKPCTRCSLTTIDPVTSLKDANLEPITTLRTYRMMDEAPRRQLDPYPVLGIYIGLTSSGGFVRLDDPVYISV